MTAILEKRPLAIDWVCVQRGVYFACAFALTFAAGGWLVSIRVEEQNQPYLLKATHQFEQVQKVAGPNPVATIKCERRRGDVAETVAAKAKADVLIGAPSADLNSIPDCPPPPKAPAPQPAPR